MYIEIERYLRVNCFFQYFPWEAICEMGLQSLGSELFLFVLGIGVTVLDPHAE